MQSVAQRDPSLFRPEPARRKTDASRERPPGWEPVALARSRALRAREFADARASLPQAGPNLFGLLIALVGIGVYLAIPAALLSYLAG